MAASIDVLCFARTRSTTLIPSGVMRSSLSTKDRYKVVKFIGEPLQIEKAFHITTISRYDKLRSCYKRTSKTLQL